MWYLTVFLTIFFIITGSFAKSDNHHDHKSTVSIDDSMVTKLCLEYPKCNCKQENNVTVKILCPEIIDKPVLIINFTQHGSHHSKTHKIMPIIHPSTSINCFSRNITVNVFLILNIFEKIIFETVSSLVLGINGCVMTNLSGPLLDYSNLKITELSLNEVYNLNPIFINQTHLERIEFLNMNMTEKLSYFGDQTNLTTLRLGNNNLKSLDGLNSLNLNELISIDNPIERLTHKCIGKFTKLKYISLSGGNIQNLLKTTFNNTFVENVYIESDNLTFIEPSTFVQNTLKNVSIVNRAKSMHYLQNQIFGPSLNFLKISCGLKNISNEIIANDSSLLEFDLSNNNLQEIPSNLFNNLTKLVKIDLSHNEISTLPFDLDLFNKSIFLDISHNKIEILQKEIIDQLQKKNVTKIDFSHNPWICSNEFDRMKSDLKHIIKNVHKLECDDRRKSSSVVVLFLVTFLILSSLGFILWISYCKSEKFKVWIDNKRAHLSQPAFLYRFNDSNQ